MRGRVLLLAIIAVWAVSVQVRADRGIDYSFRVLAEANLTNGLFGAPRINNAGEVVFGWESFTAGISLYAGKPGQLRQVLDTGDPSRYGFPDALKGFEYFNTALNDKGVIALAG